ncbi:hypothetical protein M3J09_010609 [Ascochyta lentis]
MRLFRFDLHRLKRRHVLLSTVNGCIGLLFTPWFNPTTPASPHFTELSGGCIVVHESTVAVDYETLNAFVPRGSNVPLSLMQ